MQKDNTLRAIEKIGEKFESIEMSLNEISKNFIGLDNRILTIESKTEKLTQIATSNSGRITDLERDKIIRDAQLKIYRNITVWSSGIAAAIIGSLIIKWIM